VLDPILQCDYFYALITGVIFCLLLIVVCSVLVACRKGKKRQ